MVLSFSWTYAALSLGLTLFANQASAGTLSSPSNGLVVATGDSFSFAYEDSNWCEDGYSEITVWITDYAPTTANLNSTGEFDVYSYYYGAYLIPNFGLSELSGYSLPPSSLVLPEMSGIVSGDEVYLAVVETGAACPPGVDIPPQYRVTDASIVVG